MRKLIAIILTCGFALSITACGSSGSLAETPIDSAMTEESTAAISEAPVETDAALETPDENDIMDVDGAEEPDAAASASEESTEIQAASEIMIEDVPDVADISGVTGSSVKTQDLENKFGADPDYDTLFQEQLTAAEHGEKKAARYVGLFYELGLGTAADPKEAVTYYEMGIGTEDLTCSYYLGLLYLQGIGVEQDYGKAAELFASLAETENKSPTGVVESGYELAVLYELGLGVEQDMEKATELYREAADYGNEDAAAALVRLGA